MPTQTARSPSHRPHPVSRADVARWSGRARATITEAAAGPLAPACLPAGRIDAAHPALAIWARARGLDPATLMTPVTAQPAPDPAPVEVLAADVLGRPRQRIAPPAPPIDCPANIEDLNGWAFGRVVDEFGSSVGMADWVDIRKKISETRRIDLQNAESEGRLISRELVQTHVFGALETLFRRLLSDAAASITRSVSNLAKQGASTDEAERAVRVIMRDHLQHAKTTTNRILRTQDGKVEP